MSRMGIRLGWTDDSDWRTTRIGGRTTRIGGVWGGRGGGAACAARDGAQYYGDSATKGSRNEGRDLGHSEAL